MLTLRPHLCAAALAALFATAALAQRPADAAAPLSPTDDATQRATARKQRYLDDCGAAAKAVVQVVAAKIQRITNDGSLDIQVRADRVRDLERLVAEFEQRGMLPAEAFPEAARRYHRDMAQARASCRRDIKAIGRRLTKDTDAGVAIVRDLDSWCPRLVSPDMFLAAMRPIARELAGRHDAGNKLVDVRNLLAATIQDCEAGRLPAELVTERARTLRTQLEGTGAYKNDRKNKALYEKVHAATDALGRLLGDDP